MILAASATLFETPLIALALVLIVCGPPLFFLLFFLFNNLEYSSHRRRRIPRKQIAPVVAYKKAVLRPSTAKSRLLGVGPFEGVTGTPYGVDDETRSIGFHAYHKFERAADHEQHGNVLLEVVLSGNMQRWDLGWVATHQRVLQVIATCSYGLERCDRAPKRFGLFGEEVTFSCALHGAVARAESIAQRGRTFKMGDFYDHFPELKQAGVVIAAKDGANAFVPTSLGTKE